VLVLDAELNSGDATDVREDELLTDAVVLGVRVPLFVRGFIREIEGDRIPGIARLQTGVGAERGAREARDAVAEELEAGGDLRDVDAVFQCEDRNVTDLRH